jgi:hypothetical protein
MKTPWRSPTGEEEEEEEEEKPKHHTHGPHLSGGCLLSWFQVLNQD